MGVVKYEGDQNFAETALYFQTHPTKRKPVEPKEEEEGPAFHPNRPEPDPSKVFLFDAGAIGGGGIELPASASPYDTFQSTLTDGTNIPPDTHGAVGSGNFVVTADNYEIKIQNRTGGLVTSALTLDNWWSSLEGGIGGAYDPRVHYDPYKNVWIMVTDYGGPASSTFVASKLFIAISTSSNPAGTWHMYSISVDASLNNWLDFPNVGFNNRWVAITGNIFSAVNDTPKGAEVFVIDYNAMVAGTGAPYTSFQQANSFSICPALTYDSLEANLYAGEIYNNANGRLQLWKISGTTSSPSMSQVGWPTSSTAWCSSSYANNPYTSSTPPGSDFAPQLGTTRKLQTNDDRINNFVFRNGTLWTSHSVFLPYSATVNPTRSSIMWWQIDTTGVVAQNCLIDDATGGHFYGFPSIAVNSQNDALIGFSVMSSTTHPSATYAFHSHNDASSTIRPNYVYRHGLSSYYQTFGGPKNRWGDYSATVVDPSNDLDFWTNQESVSATNLWDTWWAQVKAPPLAIAPVSSATLNLNVNPNPNNGSFELDFGAVTGKPFHVTLLDATGRVVYDKGFGALTGTTASIESRMLVSGIYTASVVIDGVLINRKVEVVR